jgi:hypothetical protein
LGNRYGSLLKGWFFDDGGMLYYGGPFEDLAVAARAGSSSRLLSYNDYVLSNITDFEDMGFGEVCNASGAPLSVLQGLSAYRGSYGCGVGCTQLDDTSLAMNYSAGWQLAANRGAGDFQDDVHYATANGASVSLHLCVLRVQASGSRLFEQQPGEWGAYADADQALGDLPAARLYSVQILDHGHLE